MNFECLLLSAKAGNENAITTILQMYRPLLLKYAIIDGVLDEDLYQELSIILLKAIKPVSYTHLTLPTKLEV